MAYSSSRGSSSRGRSGGGRGAQNLTAYAVAAVLVALVIVVFVVMGGKKKAAPAPEPTPVPPTVAPPPATPPKPTEKPYPPISEALLKKGRDLAATFDNDAAKAQDLYRQANEAKKKDDQKLWQSKLHEMQDVLENIKDQWNGFIGEMPLSKDHDSEEIAKHYFGPESGRVQKQLKLLAAIKSDVR